MRSGGLMRSSVLRWLFLSGILVAAGCSGGGESSRSGRQLTDRASAIAVLSEAACAAPVDATPQPTRLVYDGWTQSSFGDSVRLSAQLTDESGGAISGRLVYFQLGADGASSVTDERGAAEVWLDVEERPGAVPLRVEFAGDAVWSPAVHLGSLDVA